MKNGDRGHFIMHPQIAYGHRGESKLRIPANSHLEYFIEIVEVAKRSHMDNGMGLPTVNITFVSRSKLVRCIS